MTIGVRRAIRDADAVAWITLYITMLLLIPARLTIDSLGSAGAPSMLVGLVSLFFWVLLHFRPRPAALNRRRPVRIAVFVFLFSAGISYVHAMSRPLLGDERSPADVAILTLLSWAGAFLLTQDAVDARSRLELLVWRLALCGGAIAVLGLVQIITRRLWVDEIAIPGLSGGPTFGLGSRSGFPRPAGTATHPIEYGVILAMLFPLTWHVAFFHVERSKWLRFAPAVALSAVIPLTSSRSAYLGCAIALVVCMIGWPQRRRFAMLGFIALGVMFMMVATPHFVTSVTELFTGAQNDPSIQSRTDSYGVAAEFIRVNPWFGRGLGTFLPKYWIFDNQYLVLLVTVGVVGAVAFLMLGVTAVVVAAGVRRRCDPEGRDLAMSLLAAVLAGFVCLFMFDAFAFPMTMGTLFLLLGMVGCLHRVESATRVIGGCDGQAAGLPIPELSPVVPSSGGGAMAEPGSGRV
ncbi:O-antigen ligase [Calidifontibacter indicus]|uniref:O-antigen ligase n=1 Tax=Calidifontibacter indicus TaxID=419650 RepID=A0A3D9USY7_9MICO|nr:O-antigen ligase [Calidifontibacter indicus]